MEKEELYGYQVYKTYEPSTYMKRKLATKDGEKYEIRIYEKLPGIIDPKFWQEDVINLGKIFFILLKIYFIFII